MILEKLINTIRNSNFKPELYGGFMFSDFQFMKYFPLNNNSLEDTFSDVNNFLVENGYQNISYNEFALELIVSNESVAVFADENCNHDNRQLVLIVEKYRPNSNLIDQIILELKRHKNEINNENNKNERALALNLNSYTTKLNESFINGINDVNCKEKQKEALAGIFANAFLLSDLNNLDVRTIIFELIDKETHKNI